MNTSSVKSATPRQLWALYCITKTDYRGKNLTYDEASALIKKLGNPEYRKADKAERKVVDLKTELLEYIKKEKLVGIIEDVNKALGIKSIVSNDTLYMKEEKHYHFRGFGCGFAWLEYDKRSKIGKAIEEAFKDIRMEVRELIINSFPIDLRKQLEAEGTPLGAIVFQDITINSSINQAVADFMETKGVKNVWVNSRLD
jgi:hypothetical protein